MNTYTSKACDVNLTRIKECKEVLGKIHLHELAYTDYRFIIDCLCICEDVFKQEKEIHLNMSKSVQ